MYKVICTVLLTGLLVSGFFHYRQYQKLEAYRELSRVSDELISAQDDVIKKQEILLSY